MAKKKPANASELPGVNQPEAPNRVATTVLESRMLAVELPSIRVDGYAKKRVDLTMTGEQAQTLKGIVTGLESQGAMLKSGRYVSTPLHAVQWILENVT